MNEKKNTKKNDSLSIYFGLNKSYKKNYVAFDTFSAITS